MSLGDSAFCPMTRGECNYQCGWFDYGHGCCSIQTLATTVGDLQTSVDILADSVRETSKRGDADD